MKTINVLRTILSFSLVLTLLVSLCACGGSKKESYLAPVQTGGYWGYLDEKGRMQIEPQFKEAGRFSENGKALVITTDQTYALINKKGNVLKELPYGVIFGFAEGLSPAYDSDENRIGYIDEDGDYVIDPIYTNAYPFHNGLAVVAELNEDGTSVSYHFIDKNGETRLDNGYSYLENFEENGLALAANKEGKFGFINKKGKWVIAPVHSEALTFSNGLAPVANANGEWGYIDETGKTVITTQYKLADQFADNGLAVVQDANENYRVIDRNGKIVLNADDQWKEIDRFGDNGLVAVKSKDGKWGFIDKTGAYVIDPAYKEVSGFFSDGLCAFQDSNKKWGYLNEKGKVVIKPQYKEVDAFATYEQDAWTLYATKYAALELTLFNQVQKQYAAYYGAAAGDTGASAADAALAANATA